MTPVPGLIQHDRVAGLMSAATPRAVTAPQPEGDFAAQLSAAAQDGGAEAVRQAATQLVAVALIQPVLAELRGSTMAAEPFAPGDAERRFAPLLDQHLSDRIAGSMQFGLIDAIVTKFSKNAPAAGRMIDAAA
jgi:Rod binding domain-containing protein